LVDTAIERPLQPALGISKILELNGAVPSSQLIYFHISAASAALHGYCTLKRAIL
jgi:GntR family transcriptional regulator